MHQDGHWFTPDVNHIRSFNTSYLFPIRNMALPPRDQRYQYLRFEGLEYTDADITDFEGRLSRIYSREFQLVGVRCLISWREFILGTNLHTTEEMESVGFGAYWAESSRQIPNKGDLSAYWVGISYVGDFLGTTPSYTSIRDPMLRLCHRLIACSIAGRKRKHGAMISGGQFVARLAEHFWLLLEERLQELTVIVRDLPVIDMAELARLQICDELVDTWVWVASGPERQPDATTGALAPQPPLAAEPTRTMAQRLARVEEVHEIRGTLGEQHKVMDAMARDLSRFIIWAAGGIS
ncbi:hypothetical protein Tco_0008926 [Tanacetum coccineum]